MNQDNLLNNLAEDAPLMNLITSNPSSLTDAELIAQINQLRAMRTSAQTQRSAVKSPPKPKKSFKHLLDGY